MNTKELTVLISGFHYHINNKFIKRFIDKYQIKKHIEIVVNPLRENDYDYNFFKYGECLNYINWSEIPKADENLLSNIEKEKSIAIEMLFRVNHKMNLKEREIFFYKQLRFWDYIIKKEGINLFVSDNIPHDGFDYIIYIICKFRKIRTIMFHELPTRPHRHISMYITENIETVGFDIFDMFEASKKNGKSFSNQLSNRINNYYLDMQKKPSELTQFTLKKEKGNFAKETISFVKNNYNNFKENLIEKIKYERKNNIFIFRTILIILFYQLKKFIPFIQRAILFFLNSTGIYLSEYDYYLSLCDPKIDLKKRYIYLALQYQPELSTSPLAEEFVNQLLIVDVISKSLPNGVHLYVKEHPRVSFNRNRAFYKKILSYKNVVLCKAELSTYDLIDNSIAVAGASGSVGWEAFLRSKPVLMFGYRFFQYAPNVFRIFNQDQCEKALEKILSRSININKEDILLYLEALDHHTFEGYNSRTKENLTNISVSENIDNYMKAIEKCNIS